MKQICGNIKIVIFIYDICCKRVFQDPEVQKHATQILRKMLEQEEAELQVHTHTSTNNSELKPSTLPPVYIQRSLGSAVLSDNQTWPIHFTGLDRGAVEEPVAVTGGADRKCQEESSPSQGEDSARSGEKTSLDCQYFKGSLYALKTFY